jgi:hypothetical protein
VVNTGVGSFGVPAGDCTPLVAGVDVVVLIVGVETEASTSGVDTGVPSVGDGSGVTEDTVVVTVVTGVETVTGGVETVKGGVGTVTGGVETVTLCPTEVGPIADTRATKKPAPAADTSNTAAKRFIWRLQMTHLPPQLP